MSVCVCVCVCDLFISDPYHFDPYKKLKQINNKSLKMHELKEGRTTGCDRFVIYCYGISRAGGGGGCLEKKEGGEGVSHTDLLF